MKLKELPDLYKIYVFKLSNGEQYIVNGIVKKNILASKSNFIELENGNGFNKAFIVSWKVDIGETRDTVEKNKKAVKSLEAKNNG